MERIASAPRPPSPEPDFTRAAQHDFAARLVWSVTPTYAGANHEPRLSLEGRARIAAHPGETIPLVGAVTDPDGNSVRVRWWRWKDVDTYPGQITIANPTSLTAHLTLPGDALPGQTIQLVLEATDNGTPSLTRYQRVVVVLTPCRGALPRNTVIEALGRVNVDAVPWSSAATGA